MRYANLGVVLVSIATLLSSTCRDQGIYEQFSHADFVVVNETGQALLVHVDRHDTMSPLAAGESAAVEEREWGFTCDPAPVSQLQCLQVYLSAGMLLAYQRTSETPAPWVRNDLGSCRYRYELVLRANDLGTVPDSARCN